MSASLTCLNLNVSYTGYPLTNSEKETTQNERTAKTIEFLEKNKGDVFFLQDLNQKTMDAICDKFSSYDWKVAYKGNQSLAVGVKLPVKGNTTTQKVTFNSTQEKTYFFALGLLVGNTAFINVQLPSDYELRKVGYDQLEEALKPYTHLDQIIAFDCFSDPQKDIPCSTFTQSLYPQPMLESYNLEEKGKFFSYYGRGFETKDLGTTLHFDVVDFGILQKNLSLTANKLCFYAQFQG